MFHLNRTGTARWLHGAIFLDMGNQKILSSRKRHKTQFALTKQKAVSHKLDNEIPAIVR